MPGVGYYKEFTCKIRSLEPKGSMAQYETAWGAGGNGAVAL
jgi:hypothetical protein